MKKINISIAFFGLSFNQLSSSSAKISAGQARVAFDEGKTIKTEKIAPLIQKIALQARHQYTPGIRYENILFNANLTALQVLKNLQKCYEKIGQNKHQKALSEEINTFKINAINAYNASVKQKAHETSAKKDVAAQHYEAILNPIYARILQGLEELNACRVKAPGGPIIKECD